MNNKYDHVSDEASIGMNLGTNSNVGNVGRQRKQLGTYSMPNSMPFTLTDPRIW